MKKLFLIGDSIRMCYDKYVAQALEGQAEVYWPYENCRFAEYVCYSLGDWEHRMRLGTDLDVVHWNTGLHDVIHMHTAEALTPPHIYAYYINRICDRLDDLYPNAQKVFATTTPIQEEHYTTEWFWRRNSEIVAINEAALEVLDKRGYIINDLYSLVASQKPEVIFHDAAHYNYEGCTLLARAVLEKVSPLMGVKPNYDLIHPEEETRKDILK